MKRIIANDCFTVRNKKTLATIHRKKGLLTSGTTRLLPEITGRVITTAPEDNPVSKLRKLNEELIFIYRARPGTG